MPVVEKNGLMKYKDKAGNLYILYPVTNADNIDGLDEVVAEAKKLDTAVAATSTDGVAYTATVPGITALTAGDSFIMIPNTISTSRSTTLNVNNLGAKYLRVRVSGYSGTTSAAQTANWLAPNVPVRVTYEGKWWVADVVLPSAQQLYGNVQAEQVDYSNTNSGMTATDVQGAIDELSNGKTSTKVMTTAEYNALDAKDENVLYMLSDAEDDTATKTDVTQALTDAKAYTDAHSANKSNPHGVTAEQVGALKVNSWQAATDFNTLLANGIYQCQGVNSNTPYGSDSDTHFLVQVYQHTDSWLRQTAFDVRTQRIYTRTKLDGNWQVWNEILRIDGSGNLQIDSDLILPHGMTVNGWSNFEQIKIKNYGNPFECGQYIDLHAVDSDTDYTTRIYADKEGVLRMAEAVSPGDASIRPSAILSSDSTPGSNGTIFWQYG